MKQLEVINFKKHLRIPFILFFFLTFSFTAFSQDDEEVYMKAEVMPEFPGGIEEFGKYLGENIVYPQLALEKNISGAVYVKFLVKKDGEITLVQLLRGSGGGCDEEALRVIKDCPKWKPGENMGRSVNVWFTVPIKFTIPASKQIMENVKVESKVESIEEVEIIDLNIEDDDELQDEFVTRDEFMDVEAEKGDGILMSAEVMPEFPGGREGFSKYLQKNLRYPDVAMEENIQGKVYIKFVVRKDGTADSFMVVRRIGGGCDEEAMKLLQNVPKWNPGMQVDKPVDVWYTMSINFQLE